MHSFHGPLLMSLREAATAAPLMGQRGVYEHRDFVEAIAARDATKATDDHAPATSAAPPSAWPAPPTPADGRTWTAGRTARPYGGPHGSRRQEPSSVLLRAMNRTCRRTARGSRRRRTRRRPAPPGAPRRSAAACRGCARCLPSLRDHRRARVPQPPVPGAGRQHVVEVDQPAARGEVRGRGRVEPGQRGRVEVVAGPRRRDHVGLRRQRGQVLDVDQPELDPVAVAGQLRPGDVLASPATRPSTRPAPRGTCRAWWPGSHPARCRRPRPARCPAGPRRRPSR